MRLLLEVTEETGTDELLDATGESKADKLLEAIGEAETDELLTLAEDHILQLPDAAA